MERCQCDEERALFGTKAEKVRPLTEAQTNLSVQEANAMKKEHCLARNTQ